MSNQTQGFLLFLAIALLTGGGATYLALFAPTPLEQQRRADQKAQRKAERARRATAPPYYWVIEGRGEDYERVGADGPTRKAALASYLERGGHPDRIFRDVAEDPRTGFMYLSDFGELDERERARRDSARRLAEAKRQAAAAQLEVDRRREADLLGCTCDRRGWTWDPNPDCPHHGPSLGPVTAIIDRGRVVWADPDAFPGWQPDPTTDQHHAYPEEEL